MANAWIRLPMCTELSPGASELFFFFFFVFFFVVVLFFVFCSFFFSDARL